MVILGRPRQPLQIVRARPVFILYTDAQGTRWRRVSPIELKWTDGDEDRPSPGYIFRVFDHDKHKMLSFIPEQVRKWEQEN